MNSCKNCGTQFEGNFCPNCGTKYEMEIQKQPPHNQTNTGITCNKCNSTNIQIQAKKSKSTIFLGCVLTPCGIGLMIFGIIGAMIGTIIGLIIGAIVSALMGTQYETIAVCQNCGHIFKPTTSIDNHTKVSKSNDDVKK